MRTRNRIRNTIIGTAVLAMIFCTWAHAQPAADEGQAKDTQKVVQGYGFFAPGAIVGDGSISTVHFGGGMDALIYKGLGAGAEIGYLAPWRDMGLGIGILSLNGAYHFNRNRKASPFLTGGYTMAYREGHANMVNFGAGVNYWFRERQGLRLEFRDHFSPHYADYHYLSFRIGFAFR